jgi:hypothetical protein
VFVGFNLLQSSFTGFCPAATLFHRMGLKTEAEAVRPMPGGQGFGATA